MQSTARTLGLSSALLSFLASASQAGEETLRIQAFDTTPGDLLGSSVALSGDLAICSAPENFGGGLNSGSVYTFDSTTGALLAVLEPDDAWQGDALGESIDLDGDLAILGARGDDDLGSMSGSAYVFDARTGIQISKLLANDGHPGQWFGAKVAISGTTAIVSAYLDGGNRGAVYLFDALTGVQQAKLVPADSVAGDYFGTSLAADGNTLAIGAYSDSSAALEAGSVYLYDLTTASQIAELHANDAEPWDGLGESVDLVGDLLIAGAPSEDDGAVNGGAVYVWDLSTGNQIHKLVAANAGEFDRFGQAVAIDSQRIAVGAHYAGAFNRGNVYLYDTASGIELDRFRGSGVEGGARTGQALALQGDTLLVGAPGEQQGSGAFYFVCAPCEGSSYCVSTPNSTGLAASISATGSPRLAVNDLRLRAENVPNDSFQFFHAANEAQVPFGNGHLCASGDIVRIGSMQTAVGNVAELDVDLPAAGILMTGPRYFQCWFRDGAAGGFDLSDGLMIRFVL